MSKILVTGATGFVGRCLCPALLASGHAVRAVYVTTTPPPEMSLEIEWLKMDGIGPETNWSRALQGVTHVVHLAAVAHRIAPQDRVPDALFEQVNHLGTTRLALATSESKSVTRLVLVSSIGAVTSMSDDIVNESTACRPSSAYGKSKLAAETAVQRILAATRTDWCIIRSPLLYGPGSPGNMRRLISLLRWPIPLPLKSIRNRRTFLYVGNLVDAIITLLSHPAASRRVFCVADNETLSTTQLLIDLGKAAGRPARLFPFPAGGLRLLGRVGDLVLRLTGQSAGLDSETMGKLCGSLPVDNSFIRATCGWTPPFAIQEGLQRTMTEKC